MSNLNEYETTEQLEMVYLYYLGFPHEMDKTNPFRVKMIFKGDVGLMADKLQDFWSGKTKVDARKLLNDWKTVKQSLWVDGKYKPNFYRGKEVAKKETEKIEFKS